MKKNNYAFLLSGLLMLSLGIMLLLNGFTAYETGAIIPAATKSGPMSGLEAIIAGAAMAIGGLSFVLYTLYRFIHPLNNQKVDDNSKYRHSVTNTMSLEDSGTVSKPEKSESTHLPFQRETTKKEQYIKKSRLTILGSICAFVIVNFVIYFFELEVSLSQDMTNNLRIVLYSLIPILFFTACVTKKYFLNKSLASTNYPPALDKNTPLDAYIKAIAFTLAIVDLIAVAGNFLFLIRNDWQDCIIFGSIYVIFLQYFRPTHEEIEELSNQMTRKSTDTQTY